MTVMAFSVWAVMVCATLSPGVHAHGSLRRPSGRQFCNPDGLIGVQEEAGNGARGRMGASADKNGGMPSFCGDPFEGNDDRGDPDYINHPCPIQETYMQGGIVSVEIAVMYDHGGSWELAVCCDDVVTQECLDMNKLRDAEFGEHMWYIQEGAPPDPNNRDIQIYKQDWILPDDVYGDMCLLVWTWWTGHRCVFWPCDEEVCGAYSMGKSPVNKPDMMRPGSDWSLPACERYPEPGDYPQIFRNCADIAIEKRPEEDGETTSDGNPEDDTTDVNPEDDTTDANAEDDTTDVNAEDDTTDVNAEDDTTDVNPEDDTTDVNPEDDTTDVNPEDEASGGGATDRSSASPRADADTTDVNPADEASGSSATDRSSASPRADTESTDDAQAPEKKKRPVQSTFEQNDEEEKMPSYLNKWLTHFIG